MCYHHKDQISIPFKKAVSGHFDAQNPNVIISQDEYGYIESNLFIVLRYPSQNEITPDNMPRREEKSPLSLETDHPDQLPAHAGELCSTELL